jgi:hypothetical protein
MAQVMLVVGQAVQTVSNIPMELVIHQVILVLHMAVVAVAPIISKAVVVAWAGRTILL